MSYVILFTHTLEMSTTDHIELILTKRKYEMLNIKKHSQMENNHNNHKSKALYYLKMVNIWGLFVFLNQILSFQDQSETSAINIDKDIDQDPN